MNDEPMYLVCMPVASMLTPVRDSFSAPCQRCQEPVWVSPSSQKILNRATIICPECAKKAFDASALRGDPLMFGGFIPGQLDELRENLDK